MSTANNQQTVPPTVTSQQQQQSAPIKETASVPQFTVPNQQQHQPQSKYSQLLAVIEELGKDIRPSYTGNKMSAERLKRSIIHARILVRECLMETEKAGNRSN